MQTAAAYTSRSPEFAADFAECIGAYKAEGLRGFDITATAIRNQRRLDDAQTLTLVTAVQRHLVRGGL